MKISFGMKNRRRHPGSVILVIVLFVGIGFGFLMHNLKNKLDTESFPENGQVYVYDVLKFERRDPCPVKIFSDRDNPS